MGGIKVIFLWGLLGGMVGFVVRGPLRFVLVLVAGGVVIVMTAFYAIGGGVWIPLVAPVIAWFTTSAVTTAYMSNKEKQERATLMRTPVGTNFSSIMPVAETPSDRTRSRR